MQQIFNHFHFIILAGDQMWHVYGLDILDNTDRGHEVRMKVKSVALTLKVLVSGWFLCVLNTNR